LPFLRSHPRIGWWNWREERKKLATKEHRENKEAEKKSYQSKLNMQIRYSTEPFLELEFSGGKSDFHDFAQVLFRGEGEIMADNEQNPDPYQNFGSKIVIEKAPDKKVSVTMTRHMIAITGDIKWLNLFAQNMKDLSEEAEPPYHVHIEYFPSHFFLAPESFPLVCSLRQ